MEEKILALDKNGTPIRVGDSVIWNDYETGSREKFEVWKVHNEELVCLFNDYSECEVPPQECEVIS